MEHGGTTGSQWPGVRNPAKPVEGQESGKTLSRIGARSRRRSGREHGRPARGPRAERDLRSGDGRRPGSRSPAPDRARAYRRASTRTRILAKGREVLEELFPGPHRGAGRGRCAAGRPPVRPELAQRAASAQPRAPSDLLALCLSRPALEDYIRARVAALPKVEIRGGYEAVGLLATDDRGAVIGVRVVNGSGGPSGRPIWSSTRPAGATGARPGWPRSATRRRSRTPSGPASCTPLASTPRRPLPSGLVGVLTGVSPAYPYGAVLLPLEDDRWILTLAGLGDDIPPTDVERFRRSPNGCRSRICTTSWTTRSR